MKLDRHDIHSSGFSVTPEQLAHDLALIKLSKDNTLSSDSDEQIFYDKYISLVKDFENVIDDKIRYDSNAIQPTEISVCLKGVWHTLDNDCDSIQNTNPIQFYKENNLDDYPHLWIEYKGIGYRISNTAVNIIRNPHHS